MTKTTKKYRTFAEVKEEYYAAHPEEIEGYLKGIFEDYAEDPDNSVLLSQLRVIARVKGITAMADEIGISRQGLQKALSEKGNPRLENINAIMQAMGYRLSPERLDIS
tara:strand:- start:283 stop:606 length:324 start_codon:yes stop_codon:yes gene_type:complete